MFVASCYNLKLLSVETRYVSGLSHYSLLLLTVYAPCRFPNSIRIVPICATGIRCARPSIVVVLSYSYFLSPRTAVS